MIYAVAEANNCLHIGGSYTCLPTTEYPELQVVGGVCVETSDTNCVATDGMVRIPGNTTMSTTNPGEIGFDPDAWASNRGAFISYDGTASIFIGGVLASDTPSNGQVQKINNNVITWENDLDTAGITCADKGIPYANGADNIACDSTELYYLATGNTIHADAFETDPGPIPTLDLYDSDGHDNDRNGAFYGSLSDTLSGAEDFDIFVNQQISGTDTNVVKIDADGAFEVYKNVYFSGSGIDISRNTNLVGSTGITLTGDTLTATDNYFLNVGDTIKSATNQSCNTTCPSGAIVGFDQGVLGVALPNLVSPTDATADQCLCRVNE